jgi:hypothetical protein
VGGVSFWARHAEKVDFSEEVLPVSVKRYCLVPDLQIPFAHKRAVSVLSRFIRDWEPDEVLCVGDLCDFPSLSRWHRGLRGEYDTTLSKQRDEAVRTLEILRVNHLSRSNHDDRLEMYLAQKAPALEGLDELRIEKFLRLDKLGVTFHRKPYEFSPNWWLMHGDEAGLNQVPGMTALGLAKKIGGSVVCGHTHRAGLIPHTESVGGVMKRTIYGFEVGCLMDLSKAAYLEPKAGSANWQMAAGVLYVDQRTGQSHPVPLYMDPVDGSFLFEGRRWK